MAINIEEVQKYLKVERGQMTFDAEGKEEYGIWHSRKAHVPPGYSGVTIGRGYDVSQKTAEQIREDFNVAGISAELAEAFVKFIGLRGDFAREAVQRVELPEITLEQQRNLFAITYKAAEEDVKRICNKPKTVSMYGQTDWENLDSRIKEILVDLRYRGDYTEKFRQKIQKHVVNNDFNAFKEVVLNPRSYAAEVFPSRLAARAAFLNKPIEVTETKQPLQAPQATTAVPVAPLTPMEQSALDGFKFAIELQTQQAMLFGFPAPAMPTEEEMQCQAQELIAYSNAALEEASKLGAKFQQQQKHWFS